MEAPSGQTGTIKPGIAAGLHPRSAIGALATVASWREQADAKHKRELLEVDEELARLASAIEDLQRQLTALGDFRNELVTREAAIDAEEHRRAHESLFDAMTVQSEDISARAAIAIKAAHHRSAAIDASLQQSDVAAAWKEYQDFLNNQEAISKLPASYRTALALHHETTAAKLSEAVRAADPGPSALDEAPLKLDVLYTIVSGGGEETDLASIVVPVRESVWSEWQTREDDLELLVAARVAQALYEAAHALGHITAHSMQGGHRGLLAIELDLANVDAQEARAKIEAHIHGISIESPELIAARVSLNAVYVPVSFLVPPEDDDEVSA